MELNKNDRVMYENRLGTVMSDIGHYNVTEKESYADVLLDGEEHICQIRKSSLGKINTYETVNRFEKSKTYIEVPKIEINPNLEFNIEKYAKEILKQMKKPVPINEPIQLNRKDVDHKCYEIMKEKTLYICLEELAELQQAITKFLRGKPNMENIEEEIADVEICLEWVKNIIKPNANHIEAWKDYKYNRMKTRIEKGEMK